MPRLKSNERHGISACGQGPVAIGTVIAAGVGVGVGTDATGGGAGAVVTVPPPDDPEPPQLDSNKAMKIRKYLDCMTFHPKRTRLRRMEAV
jgi:hypothetical protein